MHVATFSQTSFPSMLVVVTSQSCLGEHNEASLAQSAAFVTVADNDKSATTNTNFFSILPPQVSP